MSIEHEIRIANSKPESLTAPKFWSLEWTDEVDDSDKLTGRSITFRGEKWTIDMVGLQESIPGRVAGVKDHTEDKKAELIATEWGGQRVRVRQDNVVSRDEMRGPLTRGEAKEAKLFLVEEANCDPWLKIVHPTRGTFRQNFSIVMPGGNHQAAYSGDAGCIAIKMSQNTMARVQ